MATPQEFLSQYALDEKDFKRFLDAFRTLETKGESLVKSSKLETDQDKDIAANTLKRFADQYENTVGAISKVYDRVRAVIASAYLRISFGNLTGDILAAQKLDQTITSAPAPDTASSAEVSSADRSEFAQTFHSMVASFEALDAELANLKANGFPPSNPTPLVMWEGKPVALDAYADHMREGLEEPMAKLKRGITELTEKVEPLLAKVARD